MAKDDKKSAPNAPNTLLQQARLKHGWSQDDLAEKVGTTSVNISRWEHNVTSPRPYYRQRLCDVFGKTPAELGLVSVAQSSFRIVNVPNKRNPYFTGRDELLELLHKRLSTGAAALTQAQALYGLGGIGKTQTALEYAFRYGKDYMVIFWVRAATRETITADFVKIAELLALPEKDDQDQSHIITAVKHWLADNQDWLLILDNADDLLMAQEFLPESYNGSILFTTRDQAAGDIAASIEVEQLGLQEGTLLLLHRSKRLDKNAPLDKAQRTDRLAAEAIVKEMDGLPLALVQAASYVEETKCGLADYLALYQTHRKGLLAHRSRFMLDYPETVDAAWSISFQQVEQQKSAAADLLRLCAFLAPDAIPEELFARGAATLSTIAGVNESIDLFWLNATLDVLLRYSLIRRNSDTHILTIHRLVQTVLREHMDQETRRVWAERTVRLLNAAFPVGDYGAGTNHQYYLQYYLPHVQECATLIEQYQLYFPEAAQLLYQAGAFLYAYGLYTQSEALLQQALFIREQTAGAEQLADAEILNFLAILSRLRDDYEHAEEFHQRALVIREKMLGPEHPTTAFSLNNLGVLYMKQGKYEPAESFLQRAFQAREHSLGSTDAQTLITALNLAKLYLEMREYEQAEQRLKQIQAIVTPTFGINHPLTAQNLHLLAKMLCEQGKYDDAETSWKQAITAIEQSLGKEHPALPEILNALATLYSALGRYIEAESLCQRALSICENKLGPEHSDTLTYRKHLAEIVNKKAQQ